MCFAPQRRALFPHHSTSEPPKVVRSWCVLYMFTSKCASRHNGVHFCDISTSKSGPNVVCFVHFRFEMCFAPQRRALFRHLNFQKWSDHGVFCTFWLGNVLRATTACNFSSLIWPAGSALAALASLLFDPPEPQTIGKTQLRDFPTFSRICIFFLLTLSLLLFSLLIFLFSLPLPCSAFHLSILSEVWLLNFLQLASSIFWWFHHVPSHPISVGDWSVPLFWGIWSASTAPLFWGPERSGPLFAAQQPSVCLAAAAACFDLEQVGTGLQKRCIYWYGMIKKFI